MMNLDLYNAIFQRKSIRKYEMMPLPMDLMMEIKDYVNGVKRLDKTIKVDFSYLSTDDVKNLLPVKAPHYICVYSDKKDGYLMNIGFMLQQIDLYLSARGLGSCWLGMAKPAKEVPKQKDGMDFVIMLAFGNSAEPLYRTDLSEFKRKELGQISNVKGIDDILKATRLAPSATNSQPWFFTGTEKEIQIGRVKLGFVKAPLYDKMNQIDIGIAACHMFLATEIDNKDIGFVYKENSKSQAPKGYDYVISAEIKKKNY